MAGTRIGERLRATRLARGLTQEQLADKAELQRPTVNQIERDKLGVGPKRLAQLASALEVSVLELAPEAPPDPPGLTILDRLQALEEQAAKDRRTRQTAMRGATRRLADLEARLERLEQRLAPPSTGDAAR